MTDTKNVKCRVKYISDPTDLTKYLSNHREVFISCSHPLLKHQIALICDSSVHCVHI